MGVNWAQDEDKSSGAFLCYILEPSPVSWHYTGLPGFVPVGMDPRSPIRQAEAFPGIRRYK